MEGGMEGGREAHVVLQSWWIDMAHCSWEHLLQSKILWQAQSGRPFCHVESWWLSLDAQHRDDRWVLQPYRLSPQLSFCGHPLNVTACWSLRSWDTLNTPAFCKVTHNPNRYSSGELLAWRLYTIFPYNLSTSCGCVRIIQIPCAKHEPQHYHMTDPIESVIHWGRANSTTWGPWGSLHVRGALEWAPRSMSLLPRTLTTLQLLLWIRPQLLLDMESHGYSRPSQCQANIHHQTHHMWSQWKDQCCKQ